MQRVSRVFGVLFFSVGLVSCGANLVVKKASTTLPARIDDPADDDEPVPDTSASALTSTVSLSASTVLESQTLTVTLQARLADGSLKTTGGDSVAFSLSGGTSSGVFSTVTDNNNGTYVSTFTASTPGSEVNVVATINSVTLSTTAPLILVQNFCSDTRLSNAPYAGGGDGSSEAQAIVVCTATQLNQIGANPSDWGKYFILLDDIDLASITGTSWNRIGGPDCATSSFTGTLDGRNHNISNFTYAGAGTHSGFFRCFNGTLTDVNFPNINVTGTDRVGLVSVMGVDDGGETRAVVSNVLVTGTVGSIITPAVNLVGGLVGEVVANATLSEVDSSVAVTATGDSVGGVIGKCVFDGVMSEITASGNVVGDQNVGGLIGEISTRCDVSLSSASGTVTGRKTLAGEIAVGGLVGRLTGGSILSSSASGAVDGKRSVGGLVGYVSSCSIIANSSATGNVLPINVSASNRIGGFVGYLADCSVEKSTATGTVTVHTGPGGSFVGEASSSSIIESSASGIMNGNDGNSFAVGGFAGFLFDTSVRLSSYSGSSVDGDNTIGGFVGQVSGGVFMDNYVRGANVKASWQKSGGFVGDVIASSPYPNFSRNFSVTTFTSTSATLKGGFVGSPSSATFSGNFYDQSVAGFDNVANSQPAGINDEVTGTLQLAAVYEGENWDFGGVWQISGAGQYPSFRAQTNREYYVSPSGDDNNFGSFASPFATVQAALNLARAGDTIYLRAGTYEESVVFPNTGYADAGFITLRNYASEEAVLDGTSLTVGATMRGLVTMASKSYLRVQGLTLRNYATSTSGRVPLGIFIYGSGSHLEILNNTIHDIEHNGTTGDFNAHGIAIYGDSSVPLSNILVQGNTLRDLIMGSSEALVVSGNVTDFTITRNTIHDVNNIAIDVIGHEGMAPSLDQARNGVVSYNTIYNVDTTTNPAYAPDAFAAGGIYVDGGADILIEGNLIHDVDIGIELASEAGGTFTSRVIARNNVIYDINSAGISIGGYAGNRGGTEDCVIVNNTVFNADLQQDGFWSAFQLQFHTHRNVIKNNIFHVGASGRLLGNEGSVTLDNVSNVVDKNIYFSTNPTLHWSWNNTSYSTFAAYQAGSGQDASSLFVDPLFSDLAAPNLAITASSPALNAGEELSGGLSGTLDVLEATRKVGAAIDIGAYERQ